jgi:hypothetical protein
MKRSLATVLCTLALFSATTVAQPLPDALLEEVLVKTSLLTFNDANVTGNYDVLHAKLAKPFRERFSPADLKQSFKSYAGKHIDLIAAKPIVRTSEASIKDGRLRLRGYFDTAPNRLTYELDFVVSEGEWKLISLHVRAKPPSTSEAAGAGLQARAGRDVSGSDSKVHP